MHYLWKIHLPTLEEKGILSSVSDNRSREGKRQIGVPKEVENTYFSSSAIREDSVAKSMSGSYLQHK